MNKANPASQWRLELAKKVALIYTENHFWRWQIWLARGDSRMMLFQSFFEVQRKLLHILLGINRRFYFGFKWPDFVVDEMDIKLKDFNQRLKCVYHVDSAKGAHMLTALVEETYDLARLTYQKLMLNGSDMFSDINAQFWIRRPPSTRKKINQAKPHIFSFERLFHDISHPLLSLPQYPQRSFPRLARKRPTGGISH